MKQLSVLMITRNGEAYIREQLESVLQQLAPEDELIISDDGSTDQTLSILREYKRKNVKLMKGPQRGVNANVEAVIRQAQGDVLVFCDQDDRWREGKLEAVRQIFSQPNPPVCYLHHKRRIDAQGNLLEEELFRGCESLFANVLQNTFQGSCMAIDRSMVPIVLPIPHKSFLYDQWIGCLCLQKGQICLDPRIFLEYRIHGQNVSVGHRHSLLRMMKFRLQLVWALANRKWRLRHS